MNIKIKVPYSTSGQIFQIVGYITSQLNGDDYDGGVLECARATADNVGRMLGKLIDILAKKKILDSDDFSELLDEKVELVDND